MILARLILSSKLASRAIVYNSIYRSAIFTKLVRRRFGLLCASFYVYSALCFTFPRAVCIRSLQSQFVATVELYTIPSLSFCIGCDGKLYVVGRRNVYDRFRRYRRSSVITSSTMRKADSKGTLKFSHPECTQYRRVYFLDVPRRGLR